MPIRPELRHLYGPAWKALAKRLKDAAGWQCQNCGAAHGTIHPIHGKPVQIGVAHRNRIAGDDRPENLAVWCRHCHLEYDRPAHMAAAHRTRRGRLNTPDLFEETA